MFPRVLPPADPFIQLQLGNHLIVVPMITETCSIYRVVYTNVHTSDLQMTSSIAIASHHINPPVCGPLPPLTFWPRFEVAKKFMP